MQDDNKTSNNTGTRPTLVFNFNSKSGWDIENIGSSSAMDVLVAHKDHNEEEWKQPVRLDTLRVGQKINLPWVGYNPDNLGASYQDDLGNKRHSFTDEDRSEVKSERFLPNWEESQIKKPWELGAQK